MKIAVIFDNSVTTLLASQAGSALPSQTKNSLIIKFLQCYKLHEIHFLQRKMWGGKNVSLISAGIGMNDILGTFSLIQKLLDLHVSQV